MNISVLQQEQLVINSATGASDLVRVFEHTTRLFALSDHDIVSREWRVIKYSPIIMVGLWYYNQSGVTELFIMRDIRVGCVLSQLKPFLPFQS